MVSPGDWLQFGALGIVALVVGYLLRWMTGKLNGTIDRNTEATSRAAEAHKASAEAATMVAERLEHLASAAGDERARMLRELQEDHRQIMRTLAQTARQNAEGGE